MDETEINILKSYKHEDFMKKNYSTDFISNL